ncbi:zf-B_box domain-containing protein [Cephalotus follicularis]|uniref:Zf-B_box domain-containing protein n=1 Tax=Cephalotus follicularis TaxID=3775 RepID=A0A1Q3BWT3_CEPFO|nr:zf-B_box domain-containing protein [Cephalotus follicularis]
MKIQCDVCSKDEAFVFCTADEAALCGGCDHRVHHANKLASKHQRFSLLHPSSKQYSLCDICQEKRAFLFCQQDRAILCGDCDYSIHTANELTQKHNRFLLTGVKLSATAGYYTVSSTDGCDLVPSDPESHIQQQPSIKKPAFSADLPLNLNTPSVSTTAMNNISKGEDKLGISEGGGSTSSISEYLEMLPGWHVEDFLDSSSTSFGFCKLQGDDGMLPLLGTDFDKNMSPFSPEKMGIWVPRAPTTPLYPYSSHIGEEFGLKEATSFMKTNRRWTDDAFTVPQIRSPSIGSKRSRPLW